MKATLYIASKNQLGEGPVWDYTRNELIWVDIENRCVNFYNITTTALASIAFESRVGAIVPVSDNDLYVVGFESGLYFLNRATEELDLISSPESHIVGNRFNDGKCDPSGRFWIGSMHLNAQHGKGNLYTLHNNLRVSQQLQNLTISNGIAFSPDHTKLYFIDTATSQVCQYNYNNATAGITNATTIIEVPKAVGVPDGMCIDAQGMLWVAIWGGGKVIRYNPNTGQPLQTIEVPAPNVTSCCFGGQNLDTLFITTAKVGTSNTELEAYPNSGSVFSVQPEVKGLVPHFFKLTNA